MATVLVVTASVVILKVTDIRPLGTVTDVGGMPEVELEDMFTTMPPTGAAPVSVSVPVEAAPPVTEFGFRAMLRNVGGITVKFVDFVTIPLFPVIAADSVAGTGVVETANVAVL